MGNYLLNLLITFKGQEENSYWYKKFWEGQDNTTYSSLARAKSILVGLPLGVDVAEVVRLILGEESWRAMILAILDILVTCAVVVPWGLKNFTA